MRNIFEILTCVIEMLIFFFYFEGVLGHKVNIGKWFSVIFMLAIIFNIIRSYWYLPFALNVGVTILLWIVIAITAFNGSYARKLFFVAIQTIAMLVAEILTAAFLSAIFPIEYDDAFTMRYLGMMMTTALLFLLDVYTIYIAKRKYRKLPLKYNVLVLLYPVFSMFLLLLLDSYIAQAQQHRYIEIFIAVIGLGYLNVMVFHFFDYYEKGLHVATMDAMLKANEANYVLLEENERELHLLRHDILKHMFQIKEMMKQKNNEVVGQYVEELNKFICESVSVSRTGNLMLDTILNIEKKKASSVGIQYDTKSQLLSDIKISPVDLSRILHNVIDNAIEACEHMENKYILITVIADEDTLKIMVENTSREVKIENNHIKSTKKGSANHGYGLASVKQALEPYQGYLTMEYEEGIFTCRILMNNCAKSSNNLSFV